jgi:hypothetical protein
MSSELLFEISNPCGCKVLVFKGKLPSPTGIDFITRFFDPDVSSRIRTPKHEHVLADILAKGFSAPSGLKLLISYFESILIYHQPALRYPTINDIGLIEPDMRLTVIGTFPEKHLFYIEDLLQIYELIMWQEITRYPEGKLSREILNRVSHGDYFSAVNLATFKRV